MSTVLIWKFIARFWWTVPLGAVVTVIWMFAYRLDHVTKDRDAWKKSATAYQISAGEWEASFRQAEALRASEQKRAVQGVNDAEATCSARVDKARSSAVKIEHIVTKPQECKPGETVPRSLVSPADLDAAIRGL